MEVLLEIIKVTVPALIVFLTVYLLMKEHRKKEENLIRIKVQADRLKREANPTKIHAYERLALFCERIKIDKLIMRLRTDEGSTEALKQAMIMAIQQEYDHNVTQQIYVSQQLWEIIQLAKSETISIVKDAADNSDGGDFNAFVDSIYREMEKRGEDPLEKALLAIREETRLELG